MEVGSHARRSKLLTERKLAGRERKAKRLAEKMFFCLEREGDHYTLWRTASGPEPIRRENLTLEEVEKELELFKLQGPGQ